MHTADSSPNQIAISKAEAAARCAIGAAEAIEELDYAAAVELLNKAGVKLEGALYELPQERPRSMLQRFLGGRL
jgi:chromosomal replication initiation ATPase DnaA